MEKNISSYNYINVNSFNYTIFENLTEKFKDNDLLKSLLILSFDNEIGQVIEMEYPENSLEKSSLKLISGMGFPETNNIIDEDIRNIYSKLETVS